jgi:hypothetical protein
VTRLRKEESEMRAAIYCADQRIGEVRHHVIAFCDSIDSRIVTAQERSSDD